MRQDAWQCVTIIDKSEEQNLAKKIEFCRNIDKGNFINVRWIEMALLLYTTII